MISETDAGAVDPAGLVVAVLEADATDGEILDAFDASAVILIETDFIHRLVPYAHRLERIDYCTRPWAALLAGVALCSRDRALGHAILSGARERFASEGDDRGHGYACFLEGLEELGEGHLEAASGWWQRARGLLNDSGPVDAFAVVHLALGAYARGELKEAIAIAEDSLAQAHLRGNARIEAIAAMDLTLFRFWTGHFSVSERAANLGLRAIQRIPEPENRYEEALLVAGLGAVAAVRGDFEAADGFFERSLMLAQSHENRWHDAITRTIRAELTAEVEPYRAIEDVRIAMDYFNWAEETWFVHWTHQALAVAHRELGNAASSVAAAQSLLERPLNALERGRALLCLGETHVRAGNAGRGREYLHEAVELLDGVGARYAAAKTRVLLVGVDTRRGEYLLRDARRLAENDRDDPAWRHMLRGAGRLQIGLLGEATVMLEGRPAPFKTRAEMELVAMLALAGPQGMKAEEIGDRLWPDLDWDRVNHRVDNVVSSSRRSLLPTTRLDRQRGVVTLDLDESECDATAALAEARRLLDGRHPHEPGAARELAERLRRPLLGGPTAPWVDVEQVRLERIAARLDAL